MKSYLYTIIAAAVLLTSCMADDYAKPESVSTSDDGTVTLALTLKMDGTSIIESVSSRSSSGWEAKENVTKITGYAFVFGNDPNKTDIYGDDSPLLQKVAFKSIEQDDGSSTVYVTLDEQVESCYIRLITSMTQPIIDEISGFVSQKMIDEAPVTYDQDDLTTFEDYKHISVTLLGYYNISDPDNDTPDPNNLTSNQAFPLASPGINMPDGLNDTTVAALNKVIYMVPVASKVDVSVGNNCGFTLSEVTLLNGARKARLRSTILDDDGVTVIESIPLPMNLGGTVQYEKVTAVGNTTVDTPIYLFPNDGDLDVDVDRESDEDTTASDQISSTNPTYLIIKGRAAGYGVDGYYKIPIVYQITELGADGVATGTVSDYTYDIVRNNHYKISLNKVDHAGYATFDEAKDGPANDISYSINIDTNDDSRNETIVGPSGLFSMELSASSIYVRGWSNDGIDLDLSVWFGGNTEIDSDTYQQSAYFESTGGVTITGPTTISNVEFGTEYTVDYTVTGDGTLVIRYGDVTKEMPVSYENTSISLYSTDPVTINGDLIYSASSEFVGSIYDYESDTTTDEGFEDFFSASTILEYPNISETGVTAENFYGRTFDGYVYPKDMSGGVIRLYCHQGFIPFHDAYTLNTTPSTETSNYYMINYEDFAHLSTAVNGTDCTATTFSGCDFEMLFNIDLSEGDYSHVAAGTGSTISFRGDFDGGGFTVSELSIDKSTTSYQGLFGYIYGATIKDLTVEGEVTGDLYVGGVAGYVSTGSEITNCNSNVVVEGSYYVGGIAGRSYSKNNITNCHNNAIVTANYYVGGIVGCSYSTSSTNIASVTGCTNNAAVTSNREYSTTTDYAYAGGIAGLARYSTIEDCDNYASVEAESIRTGGIVGQSEYSTVTLCDNEGAVDAYLSIGGIVGYASTSSTLSSCNNYGTVDGTTNYTGGIVGYSGGSITLSSCYNYSAINGYYAVGGIAGHFRGTMTDCHNDEAATIVGDDEYIGGVIGYMYASTSNSVTDCDNKASVSGLIAVGGIAGRGYGTLSGCYNDGNVTAITSSDTSRAVSNAGGIAGYYMGGTTIENCTNNGKIEGDLGTVAGVVGYLSASSVTISGCKNTGRIIGAGSCASGIVAYSPSTTTYVTISSCENTGEVSGTSCIAGLAGQLNGSNATVSDCENSGLISGTSSIGGIVGYIISSNGSVENSYNLAKISGTSNVGGVAGYATSSTTFDDCDNNGNSVTSSGTYTGGIVGYAGAGVSIKNSDNYATVNSSNNSYIGGVLGYANTGTSTSYVTVDNCTNNVDQSFGSSAYAGGVVGYAKEYSKIMNCTNESYVTSTASALGGVVGYIDSGTVSDCTNKGYVYHPSTTTYNVGGVVGYVACSTAACEIEDCNNEGQVYSSYIRTGGVVGTVGTGTSSISATISNCTNTAKVSSIDYQVAGIVGFLGTYGTVNESSNSGIISGTSSVGGVIGYGASYINIYSSSNSGSVSGTGGEIESYLTDGVEIYGVGGIAGQTSGYPDIYNSFNTGYIKGSQYIAGVVGRIGAYSEVYNCYNTATIEATYSSSIKYSGGIIGYPDWVTLIPDASSPTIKGCYNSGKLYASASSSNSYFGGIIGRPAGTFDDYITISYCYYLSTCGSTNSYGTSTVESTMKGTGFVTTLNDWSTSSTYSDWKYDTNSINGGYPIFDW